MTLRHCRVACARDVLSMTKVLKGNLVDLEGWEEDATAWARLEAGA